MPRLSPAEVKERQAEREIQHKKKREEDKAHARAKAQEDYKRMKEENDRYEEKWKTGIAAKNEKLSTTPSLTTTSSPSQKLQYDAITTMLLNLPSFDPDNRPAEVPILDSANYSSSQISIFTQPRTQTAERTISSRDNYKFRGAPKR